MVGDKVALIELELIQTHITQKPVPRVEVAFQFANNRAFVAHSALAAREGRAPYIPCGERTAYVRGQIWGSVRGLAPFVERGRTEFRVTYGVTYGVACVVRLRFSYGIVRLVWSLVQEGSL